MSDLLSDNSDVMNSLLAALCNPGSITPRAPLESLESWQRRAVIEHAAPYIAEAERAKLQPAIDRVASLAEAAQEKAVAVAVAAERERLANRTAMSAEVKDELDDGFQWANPDGSRWNHISRAWVESLLATHAASATAAEHERWAAVLADHYLMGVNCDPDTKRDNPMCGCSRIHLGWHDSIGAARQAWLDHVKAVVAATEFAPDAPWPTPSDCA